MVKISLIGKSPFPLAAGMDRSVMGMRFFGESWGNWD